MGARVVRTKSLFAFFEVGVKKVKAAKTGKKTSPFPQQKMRPSVAPSRITAASCSSVSMAARPLSGTGTTGAGRNRIRKRKRQRQERGGKRMLPSTASFLNGSFDKLLFSLSLSISLVSYLLCVYVNVARALGGRNQIAAPPARGRKHGATSSFQAADAKCGTRRFFCLSPPNPLALSHCFPVTQRFDTSRPLQVDTGEK